MDYGPVHAFWCFAFERCNGLLGRYHTNNEAVEVQLIIVSNKSCQLMLKWFVNLTEFKLIWFFPGELLWYNKTIVTLQLLARWDLNGEHDFSLSPSDTYIELLPPLFKGVLTTSQRKKLHDVYKFRYPDINFTHFSSFYEYSTCCVVAKEIFCITNAKERSSVVIAIWPAESLYISRLDRYKR